MRIQPKEQVIFSIDNPHDTHTMAKFLRHMDTLRATEGVKMTHCIGSYLGELEPSFMMDYDDYRRYVLPTEYTEGQYSILLVPSDVRQPCSLLHYDGDVDILEPMREVSSTSELTDFHGWTFVLETGLYFTCEKEK